MNWSRKAPPVRHALKFLKSEGSVVPEQLVEWDSRHGRHLFDWNDDTAGTAHRLYQARLFLNTFHLKLDGLRVRAFINLPMNEAAGLSVRAYHYVEDIAKNPAFRDLVIDDVSRRISNLGKELKMWRLTPQEQEDRVFRVLRESME